jgi:hypothetical protein
MSQDEIADEKSIDLAKTVVLAYNEWRFAMRDYGSYSKESNDAWRILAAAQKKYKRRIDTERRRRDKQAQARDNGNAM